MRIYFLVAAFSRNYSIEYQMQYRSYHLKGTYKIEQEAHAHAARLNQEDTEMDYRVIEFTVTEERINQDAK